MSLRVPWRIFTSYAVAWLYLVGFIAAGVVYAALSPHDRVAVLGWASTNVHNLRHDPVGALVASAFVTQTFAAAWPALIALAMFGANRVLGNWRTALVCAAGHVIGTLVSEGIVGYRVSRGLLPAADRYITDVGPSYVVVSAIVVALLYGSWLARAAAALDLTLLVVVGNIFGGLSDLDVAAVGHVTAMTVAAVAGSFLAGSDAGDSGRRSASPRPYPRRVAKHRNALPRVGGFRSVCGLSRLLRTAIAAPSRGQRTGIAWWHPARAGARADLPPPGRSRAAAGSCRRGRGGIPPPHHRPIRTGASRSRAAAAARWPVITGVWAR